MKKNCFLAFKNSTDKFVLPTKFTFPFYYDPHPLCVQASQELQQYLKTQNEWHHNFGIYKNEIEPIGKMFG
ncbi:MAG: RNA pseudouridine synthase, partial [Rhodobiaceae bacterium]|nr:RNA pseudouridine synthase [Rhodobiaceae bacterium]